MISTAQNKAAVGPSKVRIDWVDIARGFSILFVVIFHASIILENAGGLNPIFWKINNLLAPVRMPLFFAVSGLLASRFIERQDISAMSKKIVLFWYLYLLWNAIHIILDVPSISSYFSRWAASILLPTEVLWFVWALGFYFLVAAIVPKRARPVALVVTVVISCGAATLSEQFPSSALYKSAFYLPAFLALCWYPGVISAYVRRPFLALAVSGPIFLVAHQLRISGWLPPGFDMPIAVVGVVVGIVASVLIAKARYLRIPLRYLGRNTLPVYVAHVPIMELLVLYLPFLGVADTLFTLPILALISILLAILVYEAARFIRANWLYRLPSVRRRFSPATVGS